LNNDGGEFIAFYGTKGTLIIKNSTLTYTPQDLRPQPESYSIIGWPAAMRNQYFEQFKKDHPTTSHAILNEEPEVYTVPEGYNDIPDHQANFFNAIRTRKPVVENEVFGNNAALGCHLANFAYFNKTAAVWDEGSKKIVKG
jgi:hypothetical protein